MRAHHASAAILLTAFAVTGFAVTGCSATAGASLAGDAVAVDDAAGGGSGIADGVAGSPDAGALESAPLDASLRLEPGVPGLPAGTGASVDDVLRTGAIVSWLEPFETLAISLPASSDCWSSAGELVAASEHRLTVAFESPKSCGEAYAARTYELQVPAGIDPGTELELTIEGLEHPLTLTLPGR